MFYQASLLLALAASGSAHMIMGSPKPFAFEDTSTEQAPLALADFPCKMPQGTYVSQGVTNWPVGTSQDVNFIGSATHGGGSCQFSITTDPKPTKQSQWKVIESVIGGCPTNASGNFAADANAIGDAAVFSVKMPNVPSGTYTFAWTWINKIGNREFYMNCAPISVSGGTGSQSDLAALPNMYVANLDATCATAANQDFEYPDPGSNAVTGSKATPGDAFSASQGCSSITTLGAGNGKLASPATGSPSQPSGAASQSSGAQPSAAPAQPSATGKAAGVFAPGASSAPAASATPVASAPAASAPAASAPAASAPAQPVATTSPSTPSSSNNTTSGSDSTSSGDCTPCTNDGTVVCIGTAQWGLCNRGCAVAQALAAGTTCANGQISKRSIQFPRAHLHRRHGSSLL